MQKLSHPPASDKEIVFDLWCAAKGSGILRQALSEIQEVGRPNDGEKKPASSSMQVRRLVPVECEFLQGFPRNFTRIPWRGKPAEQCPDGPRYKALGNSMAVPVLAWIGKRIKIIEEIV